MGFEVDLANFHRRHLDLLITLKCKSEEDRKAPEKSPVTEGKGSAASIDIPVLVKEKTTHEPAAATSNRTFKLKQHVWLTLKTPPNEIVEPGEILDFENRHGTWVYTVRVLESADRKYRGKTYSGVTSEFLDPNQRSSDQHHTGTRQIRRGSDQTLPDRVPGFNKMQSIELPQAMPNLMPMQSIELPQAMPNLIPMQSVELPNRMPSLKLMQSIEPTHGPSFII
ncbi:hypothetical protein AAMO2058_000202600 [Amorphochlora amoebiformis]